ncbi:MAG: polysaccharide biosynthesis/export family protein [Prevotella sp.]|nr:polysaccharide biosynthesis/export family protein [Prevotella sp.]
MIDLKQLWALVAINWQWIVASVVACVFLAGLYLWFTPTKVSVNGKMEIIDKSKKGSGLSAGMAMLNNLPMGLGSALGGSLGGSLGIDSEKEIMKSNSLVRNVVKDLGLYTEYRLSKWGRKRLLYQDQPINVTLDPAHVEWLDDELPLTFHQIKLTITKGSNGYTVETTLKENKDKTSLPDQTFASLPATIKTDAGVLTITENKQLTEKQAQLYADGYTLKVVINPPMESADNFIKNLAVDPPSKKITNILGITLVDENVMRGIDFVDHLVEAYNKRANDEKNEEASKTDEFVNARLARVDAELGSSDADWERYKKQFQITQPQVDAQEIMTKKSLYETQLVEIGTQLQLHDYLNEYVNDPANLYEIIPLSLGASSVSSKTGGDNGAVATQSASLISQHNSYVNQRREFLKSMSDKAPQVQRITESIQELDPVIKTAMKRDRQSILMKRSAVEREYSRYMGRVGNAPQQERVLTEIGRQREIKQGVYLVMLQKREETAMELANVTDKGKLIDKTRLVKNSSKPQKKMVLLMALFLGLLLPVIVLYLRQMLNEKIATRKDIKSLTKSPMVGEIPLADQSEAIRNLRTNLLLGMEEGQKVIFMVSESESDGKTYLAKQLTDSLTAIGKKTLYMDLDLRSKSSSVHPADLFASDEFAKQMADAKADNDFVVVDTSALGKYNDVYQIAKFADVTCYVVKAGQTPKSVVEKLKEETRLPNVKYILNAIDMTKKKYRYYYKHALTVIVATLLLSACGSSEKVVYLENANQAKVESSMTLFDARIMPKDVLTITVNTINKVASEPFNLTVLSSGSGNALATQPALQSYLVSNDGTIDFPVVGSIKVGGLTKNECESMILEKIRPYLAESEKPIVTVRMSSYSISVLGEVKNPGSFPVSREKINIFEALALAGDMTIYGVRDRVRLIREDATGNKEIHILDLTDANIINSPYYYLQQNDMVYVEPSNIKKQDARVGSMTTLWFSATSILVSVASLIVNILR